MSKLRLNNDKREFLLEKAYEIVEPKKEIEAEKKAYQSFLDQLQTEAAKVVSEQDIKSLLKFDLAKKNECVAFYVEGVSGQIHQKKVTLKKGDEIMLPIHSERWNNHSTYLGTYKVTSPLIKRLNKWEEAKEATKDKREENRRDMRALINPAKTLEDITAVWEGAEKYRAEIDASKGHALCVLSDEKVAHIKQLTKQK